MTTDKKESPQLIERRRSVLNYYLKLRNIDIKTLAERCGKKPQTMYNIFNSGIISDKTAERMAEVLMCSPKEILDGVLDDTVMNQMQAERSRGDLEIVGDEKMFMRALILSQQRTIENLSFIAREKMNAGK